MLALTPRAAGRRWQAQLYSSSTPHPRKNRGKPRAEQWMRGKRKKRKDWCGDVSFSTLRLKAEAPESGCYLGGSSRLGTRCHWFLSAATRSAATAEAAAMSLRSSRTRRPKSCVLTLQSLCSTPQTSCPPPATVEVKTQPRADPSTVEGVSTKANQKTEQGSCAAIGQSGRVPVGVWCLPPPPPEFRARTQRDVGAALSLLRTRFRVAVFFSRAAAFLHSRPTSGRRAFLSPFLINLYHLVSATDLLFSISVRMFLLTDL